MNLVKNKKDDTDDWDQIKGWVGGGNKDTKHPIHQEMERMQRREPEHLDQGGIVGDQMAPPDENILRGTLAMGQPSQPIPTSPGVLPGASDAAYNQKSSDILGIDKQQLSNFLNKVNMPKFGDTVGRALAGGSDAIMQGVAQQGPGHALDSLDREIQQDKENQSGIPGAVASLGKEQFGLSRSLQADDPNSPFSKVKQNAERSFLKSVGFSDQDIARIPASSIDGLRSGALTRDELRQRINSDTELKKIGFGLQQQQIDATKAKNISDAEKDTTKLKTDAAKELLSHSGNAKVWGVPIPFTSDVSGDEEDAARKVLMDQINGLPEGAGGVPQVGTTFNGEKVKSVKKIR